MSNMIVTICTPYQTLHEGEADFLLFTTPQGQRGIRPGHEHAVLRVLEGEVYIHYGQKELTFRMQEAMLHFENDRASFITNFAALAAEYEEKYQEYIRLLERHYVEEMKSEAELQRAQMAMRQSLMQE